MTFSDGEAMNRICDFYLGCVYLLQSTLSEAVKCELRYLRLGRGDREAMNCICDFSFRYMFISARVALSKPRNAILRAENQVKVAERQ